MQKPERAFAGRGYHLLFAYTPVEVKNYHDISERQKQFSTDFKSEFKKELDELEVKLDSTQDLRRMVKIYGTAKPDVGVISKFYGGERAEDKALPDYLLNMNLDNTVNYDGSDFLRVDDELPKWFEHLLSVDNELNRLWNGRGKPRNSDISGSGYDMSIARKLLMHGYSDINDLATILYLRPYGSVRNKGKGEDYIRRTIAKAIHK